MTKPGSKPHRSCPTCGCGMSSYRARTTRKTHLAFHAAPACGVYGETANRWARTNDPKKVTCLACLGIGNEVMTEVLRSYQLGFDSFHSAHEGFAVLLEEVDELKAHVWMNQKKRDLAAMRKEAIQVAAMAVKFAQSLAEDSGTV